MYLLPLYHDKACSEDSRALVDEHLQGCSACRKTLAEIHEQVEHPQDMEGIEKSAINFYHYYGIES